MYSNIIIFCLFFVLSLLITNSKVNADSDDVIYNGLEQNEFMTRWLVLGPIPVSDNPRPHEEAQKAAFNRDFFVEQGGEANLSPTKGIVYSINDKKYKWEFIESDKNEIDLTKVFGEKNYVIAYAYGEILMSEESKMILGIGSDDGIKVWLNGKLVHESMQGRAVKIDNDIVGVDLVKGKNRLLLKVQNMQFGWGFALRPVKPESLVDRLINASANGQQEVLENLISHGVDVNIKNKTGLTALNMAKIIGRESIVEFLLEKGADPNIEMPSAGKIIDSIMEDATKGDSPGAAVLVAKDGKILYKKGFGFADIEKRIPVNSETKFRIGSITKQFTASAILKLQEDGLISVNDKLSKFIPDYPRGDEVTIYHLLTHTSGIHSFTSEPEFWKTVMDKVKPEDMIETFKNLKFDFNPGEKWFYNNSGYFLLGYIVEKVSGMPFDDYLREKFFEPLGMNNTGVHSWELNLENEAVGYSYEGNSYKPAMKWDMSRAGGAGAIYSTVGDLYLWNEAIFNGKILSKSSLEAAFTPAKLNDGSIADAFGAKYGYGWMFLKVRGLETINHSGGFDGFNAYLTRFPKQNLTIAVLTNCLPSKPPEDDSLALIGTNIAYAISYIYLWDQMETIKAIAEDKTVDTAIYNDYVGDYDYSPYGGILKVTHEGNKLFAQMAGQGKIEIFPSSKDKFFWKVADAQIDFIRNEKGEVTHLIHHQSGMEIKALKIVEEIPVTVAPDLYDDYVGEYDFGRAILTITREENKLFAQMAGQPKFEIFPRSETEFFWKVANAQIVFVKDEGGKVTKAILKQAGMEIEVKKVK